MIFLLLTTIAFAFDWDASALVEWEQKKVAQSPSNPSNRVLKLPDRSLALEGRINLKKEFSIFAVTLRPRARGSLDRKNRIWGGYSSIAFQEAFLNAKPAENLWLSAGRIQFGWGPAESISPSNWTVPEIQFQPSPHFEQLGLYRAQANWSVGQSFSLVAMQELQPLRDHEENYVIKDEVYRKRTLAKGEFSWNYGSQILGATLGQERLRAGLLKRGGIYSSLTLSDAWQFYFDGVQKEQSKGGKWKNLSVAGLRYTFENGLEIRMEGIYNQAGLTKSEKASQELLLARLSDYALYEISFEKAQSLLGRRYAYGGIRWTNAPLFLGVKGVHNPTVYLRTLRSLTDSSASWIGGLDLGLGDRSILSVYGSVVSGALNSELSVMYRNLLGLALKVTY